jgi:hypothetical protein
MALEKPKSFAGMPAPTVDGRDQEPGSGVGARLRAKRGAREKVSRFEV